MLFVIFSLCACVLFLSVVLAKMQGLVISLSMRVAALEAGPQIAAQEAARRKAVRTGKPADDGYGTRWHPPGRDGIPVVSATLTPR